MPLIYSSQICTQPGLYLPSETEFRAHNSSFLMLLPKTPSPMGLGILGHILTKEINV